MQVHDDRVFLRMLLRGELGAGEAFVGGLRVPVFWWLHVVQSAGDRVPSVSIGSQVSVPRAVQRFQTR